MSGQSDLRADWLPGGPSDPDLLEEPSDSEKEWQPDQKPPAEWFNWFQDSVVKDMADIAQRILVNPSSGQAGNIASPVPLGSDGIVRDYVETSGVGSFARAFNAEYDAGNDEWTQIDSNEENPFLIIVNPSFSGITGVSSSEVDHPSGLHVFEATAINSGVITWQLADLNAGQIDAFDVTAKNYLEPGGGVISNNGSNPNIQIDNTAIELWVRDFAGGGRIVELPARSPAFDISTTGVDTANNIGGMINGSSASPTSSWTEFGVIASASDDTLDPLVVGWTHTSSIDNTPQSEGDLPGNYDLFRPMGWSERTWWAQSDSGGGLYEFFTTKDGYWMPKEYRGRTAALGSGSGSFPVPDVPPGVFSAEVLIRVDDGTVVISGFDISNFSLSKYEIPGSGFVRGHSYSQETERHGSTVELPYVADQTLYYNSSAGLANIEQIIKFKAVR